MYALAGKKALVTGGSRGMGAAISVALASHGADVAFTYRQNAERAAAVATRIEAEGRRALAIKADSADAAVVRQVVDQAAMELGRLDILVNNAGIFPYGPFEDVEPAQYEETMAVHVRAVFVASQAAVARMKDGGRIISIGSSLASRVPAGGTTLYSTSKSALVGFTKGLARELGPRGITVNLVEPGSINTDMNPADSEIADGERALTALGRYGEPEDMAAMVLHLAGVTGNNITGASFAVDGGSTA
ncbi:MAG: SDR family oxidoreductase [Rhizobiaceae bacterium]|nr:SDR family oxidoreductase [Rhizobiaceae bacterium]